MFEIYIYHKNKTSPIGLYEFEYSETETLFHFVINKWIGYAYEHSVLSNDKSKT